MIALLIIAWIGVVGLIAVALCLILRLLKAIDDRIADRCTVRRRLGWEDRR